MHGAGYLVGQVEARAEAVAGQKLERALPLGRECAAALRVKAGLEELAVDGDVEREGVRRASAAVRAAAPVRRELRVDDRAQEGVDVLDALRVLPRREALRLARLDAALVRPRDVEHLLEHLADRLLQL